MYEGQQNEYGCPLVDQRGPDGVHDFDAIVAQLPPPLRAAFERERRARRAEQRRIRAAAAILRVASAIGVAAGPAALGRARWLGRFRPRASQRARPRPIGWRLVTWTDGRRPSE